MPDKISFGIPDNWGAAAVVYALIEGLAGVKDDSTEFKETTLSPRWAVTETENATISVKYPSSQGYLYYTYNHNQSKKTLNVVFTGNSHNTKISILIPEGTYIKKVSINSKSFNDYSIIEVENSKYLKFSVTTKGIYDILINY